MVVCFFQSDMHGYFLLLSNNNHPYDVGVFIRWEKQILYVAKTAWRSDLENKKVPQQDSFECRFVFTHMELDNREISPSTGKLVWSDQITSADIITIKTLEFIF